MKIKSSSLPISRNYLRDVRHFCQVQRQKGNLVICGGVSQTLRVDYADQSLPLPERAMNHFNVSPRDWRLELISSCNYVAGQALNGLNPKYISAYYLWRAGLGFLPSFDDLGVKINNHFGLRRSEKKPDKTDEIYLAFDPKILKRKIERHIIADIMLATGGSYGTFIKMLISLGVKTEQIKLACLIAAPEGIYNLLREFPNITIYAGELDSHLDKSAFLYPGLGDAGDKLFSKISLKFFETYRQYFNDDEWELLSEKIEQANPVQVY